MQSTVVCICTSNSALYELSKVKHFQTKSSNLQLACFCFVKEQKEKEFKEKIKTRMALVSNGGVY